jgi:hypothetical protein
MFPSWHLFSSAAWPSGLITKDQTFNRLTLVIAALCQKGVCHGTSCWQVIEVWILLRLDGRDKSGDGLQYLLARAGVPIFVRFGLYIFATPAWRFPGDQPGGRR